VLVFKENMLSASNKAPTHRNQYHLIDIIIMVEYFCEKGSIAIQPIGALLLGVMESVVLSRRTP
jgi:hypothetical protein